MDTDRTQRKTTIITGATGGIGQVLAESYLREGQNVVLGGRDPERLQELARRLSASDRVALVAGDLRDLSTAERLVETAVASFGPTLTNVVHNAGTFLVRPFLQTTPDDLDPYLDFFRGAYRLTQCAVEQIQRQAGGRARSEGAVVFISTQFTEGFIAQFPCSAVGAVKSAFSGFTRATCHELAELGIRVNTLNLGVIETPIYGLDREGLRGLRSLQPLNENGRPEDVAEAVLFLTERSPFTTGQVIALDGGVSAGHYAGAC